MKLYDRTSAGGWDVRKTSSSQAVTAEGARYFRSALATFLFRNSCAPITQATLSFSLHRCCQHNLHFYHSHERLCRRHVPLTAVNLIMAETEPESPINKMEKDHFVSPVKTLRRVTSLLSYQPSLASIPPDLRNDGYLGHWTLDHTWSIILGLVLAGFQAYSTGRPLSC